MDFHSPSKGILTLEEVTREIAFFMNEDQRFGYSIIIGTDSQAVNGEVDFVNAIVVHRKGRGGRYFWRRQERRYKTPLALKARMFSEAQLSIELAIELLAVLQNVLADAFIEIAPQIEVHIDIGVNGPTRDMIKELVGLVKGSGFEAKIKPDAYAASTVADKYT